MTESATDAPSTVNTEFARKALLHACAIESLVNEGCEHCLTAFSSYAEARLRVELETGNVHVVDDYGKVRYGVTPKMLAKEIRNEFDAPNPGRFFRKK